MWTGASGEFDEASYLSGYMDVAKMVADGKYRCGAHHFWEVGRKEGRQGFAVPVVADDTPPPVKNTPEPVDAITDPNFASKMEGFVELNTDANFSPKFPAEHAALTQKFRKTHQNINDMQVDEIIAQIRGGDLPIKKDKVDYHKKDAHKDTLAKLQKAYANLETWKISM